MQTITTLLFSTIFVFVVERFLIHLWDKAKITKNDKYRRR